MSRMLAIFSDPIAQTVFEIIVAIPVGLAVGIVVAFFVVWIGALLFS